MSDSRPRIRPSGFGIAVLAFALTRLHLASAIDSEVEAFVLAGVVPLAVGLGLALFGVAIGVGAVSKAYARTVWRWSALGTVAMLGVVTVTAMQTIFRGQRLDVLWDESGILISNVLLGGAILGAIVGDRAARHHRTNERLVQYAERTMLVNRRLRHEVLNAIAIVKGYATDESELGDSTDAIHESTERMERTVEHVEAFAATTGELTAVDVGESVESILQNLPEGVDVSMDRPLPENVLVRADDRLELLVAELVENAVKHTDADASVGLDVVANARTVEIIVRDDGPGLPEPAQRVLTARGLPEYDDPTRGYGLQMVRLLVEQYDGAIEATHDEGTELTVTLQRTRERSTPRLAYGVPTVDLYRASVAAIVAGTVMGLLTGAVADSISDVGSLYGTDSATVGWVAHLFHSAVFGLLFAVLCSLPTLRERGRSFVGTTGIGIAWGVVLWLVGSGLLMPVWLMAMGADATLPGLSAIGLAGHLVWGTVLGALYAVLPDAAVHPAEAIRRWRSLTDR